MRPDSRRPARPDRFKGRIRQQTNLLAALFPVLVVLVAGCRAEERPTRTPLRPVRTMRLAEMPIEQTRVFSGVSRPALEIDLSFRVAGRIESLPVDIGSKVERGELVGRLDDDDFRIRVREAEAAVAQAQAQERNASANYERVRRLYENDNAALSDLDAARAAFESARAQVRAADQRLAMARKQLKYTTLRAPVDGVIADLRAEADENVVPGQTIAILHDTQTPEVEIDVPGAFIGDLTAGETGRVRFDALPEATFRAEVTEIAPAALGRSTFPVVLKLLESAPRLRPGLAAEVELRVVVGRADTRGLVVPSSAIGDDRRGRFAFVVTASHVEPGVGVVQRRGVELGALQPDGLVVSRGLAPGDVLITAGVSFLEDGQRVSLWEKPRSLDAEPGTRGE